MHFFIFPERDATLYQASGSLNTGLDEILEIRKDVNVAGTTVDVSRVLIQFDLTKAKRLEAENPTKVFKYYLNLFDARPSALSVSQSLFAYPVSGSWTMGQGRLGDNPQTTEGCSFNFRDGATVGTNWIPGVSGSGGSWFTGSQYEATHSLNHRTEDVRMDVTNIVNQWLDDNIVNNGFIVKRSGSLGEIETTDDEGSNERLGNLSFFSSDTHTKYPPTLEIQYDDSVWDTGSLSPLSSTDIDDLVIYMKGLRPEYKEKSRAKFRVVGRERYPEKTFASTPSTLTVKYLPSGSASGDGSFYQLQDAETEDIIVPFGSGSRISCDSNGNFFNLDLDGFQPERFYSILFQVVSGSGTNDKQKLILDEGFTFKVSI